MRLQWLKVARVTRSAQLQYIWLENPEAADRLDAEIERQLNTLRDHPYLGREGRIVRTRELVITRTPFIAVYRVTATEITILRILHGTQDWPPTKPKP